MTCTFDKEERSNQKRILRGMYADYNPVHHDVFVARYNRDVQAQALNQYMASRGLIKQDVPEPELVIRTTNNGAVYAWRIEVGDLVAWGNTRDECMADYLENCL